MAAALTGWTTTRLAEQTVVVPIDEHAVASITPEVARGAGGVILFGRSAPADLAVQLARLSGAAPSGLPPLVMTDEEGGAVQRLANLVGEAPSARQMGATMTPAEIRALAAGLGRRLRSTGVTMDLAPVLDADGGAGPSARNPDGSRSFSADPTVAAADGLAFARGLEDGGVVPVVKHFPGLGGATGNTDAVAASTQPWAALAHGGALAFDGAVSDGVPAMMVSNASIPGLTGLPASISPAVVTTLLRDTLHYRGLVMTDSLSASALRAAGYSVPAAAVAAVAAGADMVLFTAGAGSVAALTDAVVGALVAAVDTGSVPRARLVQAAERVLMAKGVDLCA